MSDGTRGAPRRIVHAVEAPQPGESPRRRGVAALRKATWSLAIVAGCARGSQNGLNLAGDASITADGSAADARQSLDARPPGADAPIDASRPLDATLDAGCSISNGVSPMLNGSGDLAKYPAAQDVALGATLGSGDAAAIAWDSHALYITMTSSAFTAAYEPLHVYVQAGTDLGTATPAMGKAYGGLVPDLPFTATQLIAVRQVSDSGTDGPYDGVYTPDQSWDDRATPLSVGSDVFVSSDDQTISVQVAWSALGGCPTMLRLAAHVVNGATGNEWKDLIPTTTTPWQAPGGGYYQIDLSGSAAVAAWTLE